MEIVRGSIFHTPRNAFDFDDALEYLHDGALAIEDGRIVACDSYAHVRAAYPGAAVADRRGRYILPGFIDTHVHFPQVRIIGGLGYSLLDWLDRLTLPEEAKLADERYAYGIAQEFVRHLAAHGTTTALVFGSHFAPATALLFEAAERSGLRVISGLVLADRMLRPELHQSTGGAYDDSRDLIRRFHGKGRLAYAVTPRFALSCSEPMLEVCETLMREDGSLRFTTHINESRREVEEVARLFPWAGDYLSVYERFGLLGRRSVLAHNVFAQDGELRRLADHAASVAHCPCSNAALGSGIFPLRRHLDARVRFALGTDVGGGTGFGMMKEALQAYMLQRVAAQPVTLTPAQLLYLATRAGAEALDRESSVGCFGVGMSADLVCLQPPPGSVLEGVLGRCEDADEILAALFTLGGSESVREVRVGGDVVHAA